MFEMLEQFRNQHLFVTVTRQDQKKDILELVELVVLEHQEIMSLIDRRFRTRSCKDKQSSTPFQNQGESRPEFKISNFFG